MAGLAQALIDRYRCPEEFVDLQLTENLSEDSGFFRFGPGAVCYGQSTRGIRERDFQSGLCDTFNDFIVDGSKLLLPFNPTHVIENCRRERYFEDHRTSSRRRRGEDII